MRTTVYARTEPHRLGLSTTILAFYPQKTSSNSFTVPRWEALHKSIRPYKSRPQTKIESRRAKKKSPILARNHAANTKWILGFEFFYSRNNPRPTKVGTPTDEDDYRRRKERRGRLQSWRPEDTWVWRDGRWRWTRWRVWPGVRDMVGSIETGEGDPSDALRDLEEAGRHPTVRLNDRWDTRIVGPVRSVSWLGQYDDSYKGHFLLLRPKRLGLPSSSTRSRGASGYILVHQPFACLSPHFRRRARLDPDPGVLPPRPRLLLR
jgi:hypothetical protein